jgi:hypothetical protein
MQDNTGQSWTVQDIADSSLKKFVKDANVFDTSIVSTTVYSIQTDFKSKTIWRILTPKQCRISRRTLEQI